MGLGGTRQDGPIYYCTARAHRDKKVDPHFKIQKPLGGQKYEDLPDQTALSGYLVGITHKEFEWDGATQTSLGLMVVDGGERFKIEFSLNTGFGRGLINTITGTKDFDYIEIRLYVKNDQPNLYITNNGQKTIWKYDYKKELTPMIPEMEDPKTGKMVKVYRKVNAMLLDDWKAMESYVSDRARSLGLEAKGMIKAGAVQGQPQKEGSLQEEFDRGPDADLQNRVDSFYQPPSDTDDLPF